MLVNRKEQKNQISVEFSPTSRYFENKKDKYNSQTTSRSKYPQIPQNSFLQAKKSSYLNTITNS